MVLMLKLNKIIKVADEDVSSYEKNGYKKFEPKAKAAKTAAQTDPNPLDELKEKTVDELIAYAKEKNIDIGQAKSQDSIMKKITEALKK